MVANQDCFCIVHTLLSINGAIYLLQGTKKARIFLFLLECSKILWLQSNANLASNRRVHARVSHYIRNKSDQITFFSSSPRAGGQLSYWTYIQKKRLIKFWLLTLWWQRCVLQFLHFATHIFSESSVLFFKIREEEEKVGFKQRARFTLCVLFDGWAKLSITLEMDRCSFFCPLCPLLLKTSF